jgi:hypothetical protein
MSKDLKTIIPELGNASIRRTPDGMCSVFDLISVVGGQKNPRDTWKSLAEQYPEVVGFSDNFQFPGQGQRKTPVTDREGWAYILGLLPGVMGRKYRESAAELVLRYLDADIGLAAEVVDRNEDQEDLEWLEARIRSKVNRKRFTGVLKSHGVKGPGYAICTNKVYQRLFGGTAKQLKKQRGLKNSASLRNDFSVTELNTTSFTEDLSGKKVDKDNARGNKECAKTCDYVARRVASFTEDVLGA